MTDDPHDIDPDAVDALREKWGIEDKPHVVTAAFPGHVEFEVRSNLGSHDTYHFWVVDAGGRSTHVSRMWFREEAEKEIKRYMGLGVEVKKWSPY